MRVIAIVMTVGAVMGSMGCAGSAKWSALGSSGHSGGGASGGSPSAVTMPDLTLMTQAEAEETLRRAGFTAAPALDSFACGSTLEDKRVVELGRVCHQAPAPGRPASTAIPVSLRVQDENPWHGEYRPGRAWFLMPDFAGKDVEVAKAKLRELGFTAKEVKIAYVTEPACKASTVCRTSPGAWERADNTSDKIFFIGQPPEVPAAGKSSTSAASSSASTPAVDKPKEPPPAQAKPADIF